LADAIVEGAGREGARGFWRKSLHDTIDVPFVRPLVHGALFLWGDTPAGLVRRTPHAWHLVTRGCGDFKAVEADEQNAIVFRSDNLAPLCRADSLIEMWAGGLEGQIDWVGVEGSVETRSRHFLERGVVEFIVRWKPKVSTLQQS
jgi:hypothetical protein